MNTCKWAAESIGFRRSSGHNVTATPDERAPFQLWSFLFARKAAEARSNSKTHGCRCRHRARSLRRLLQRTKALIAVAACRQHQAQLTVEFRLDSLKNLGLVR
jgi:hypothetical protein